jgi:hypothetical protein
MSINRANRGGLLVPMQSGPHRLLQAFADHLPKRAGVRNALFLVHPAEAYFVFSHNA